MISVDESKKYALAVSGGADSMAMLDMFCKHLPKLRFFVVTVNHNLRENGAKDAEFVEKYCAEKGVECLRFDVDVATYCKQNKVSTESGARILRYGVLNGVDADFVCLAHNQDDNVESILMHLLRGSGIVGAVGIKQYSGRYFRPLLGFTKEQLTEYCKENGVPFVTDETNFDIAYTRNYLRHEIIPRLKKINDNAVGNVVRFAENLSSDNDCLDKLADISSVVFSDNQAQIPKQLLLQHKAVAVRTLQKVFAKMGVTHDVESKHYQAIISLAHGVGGKKLCLPFDLIAVNDYNIISIFVSSSDEATQFCLPFQTGEICTPFGTVVVSPKKTDGALTVDLGKIPQTAVIRTARQGDLFTKFGGGTKPLTRYFIDKKIPQRERCTKVLIADGNNVLAICGVEISQSVKVDDHSEVYYVTIIQEDYLNGAHKFG